LPCKHVYAALIVRAKTAEECVEDNHDGLTYFDGDQLCRVCADNAGVAY
jgi:hypothetical protein